MKKLLVVTFLVCSVVAAKQGYNMPSFSYFDINVDGKISQAELEEGRANRMNKNAQDGKMLRNAKNAASFSDIDTNGNGYISKDEFEAHQNTMKAK